jgi:hypothetical protein
VSLIKSLKWLLAGAGARIVLLTMLAYSLLHTEAPTVAARNAPLMSRLGQTYPGPPRAANAEALLSWAK